MTRVKSLSKVNRKGQALKYLLSWSIFFPKEIFGKWLANRRLRRFRTCAHDNQVREAIRMAPKKGKKKRMTNINGANSNPFRVWYLLVGLGLGSGSSKWLQMTAKEDMTIMEVRTQSLRLRRLRFAPRTRTTEMPLLAIILMPMPA